MSDIAIRLAGLRAAMNGVHWGHDYPGGGVTGPLVTVRSPRRTLRQWTSLSPAARDAEVRRRARRLEAAADRLLTTGIAIDSLIDGKRAIHLNGGRIVLEGDRDWLEASIHVGYSFDEETWEETLERSRRNVAAGRERLDAHLKAQNLHEMMTGKYAPLYQGYVGSKRKGES